MFAIAVKCNGEIVGYLRILKNGCKATKNPHKCGGRFETLYDAFRELVFNVYVSRMYSSEFSRICGYKKEIVEL